MWTHPGITSIVVPYFDTNDFYFSGHVASTTMYACEFWASGWPKTSIFTIAIMLNQWSLMTMTRTHYIIDMITGLFIAFHFHRISEVLCYFWDVKVFGIHAHHRQMFYYAPCPKCGWSNNKADL